MSMDWPDTDKVSEREGDDYDLMTYGEAAARLAELIEEERKNLARLEAANSRDEAAIAVLTARVELLVASNARYQQESLSSEAFTRRFGFPTRDRVPETGKFDDDQA